MEVEGSQDNFFFSGIDKVRFRKPVTAGDTLVMRMTLLNFQKRFGLAKMEACPQAEMKETDVSLAESSSTCSHAEAGLSTELEPPNIPPYHKVFPRSLMVPT
ncbi:unnamed protein product [Brassica oleracea]|uniref:Uncharacterized protein n=2 Tax=Brassica TaxID=3705 RepID=A0A0D3C150_BRAOL|nr:unnamed protein product [Brassica napus]